MKRIIILFMLLSALVARAQTLSPYVPGLPLSSSVNIYGNLWLNKSIKLQKYIDPASSDTLILIVNAATGLVDTVNVHDFLAFVGGGYWNITGSTLHPQDTTKNVAIGTNDAKGNALRVDGRVLFGSDTSGVGGKFMWIPSVRAIRAGYVNGTQWDYANIGHTSVALGQNCEAKEESSVALGWGCIANGIRSVALGDFNQSYGVGSFSAGAGLIAGSAFHSVHGFLNDTTGFSTWDKLNVVNTDPIFTVGNGYISMGVVEVRRNAFNILKDGTVSFGGVSFPTSDGLPGQSLVTDGAGVVSWGDGGGSSWCPWDSTSPLKIFLKNTANAVVLGDTAQAGTEKLRVTGGSVLFDGTVGATPVNGAGTRMMWIPSIGSIYAGVVSGTQWDAGNIADYSATFGYNNRTTNGHYGITSGSNNVNIVTNGSCFGGNNRMAGNYGLVSGYQLSVESQMGVAFGKYNRTDGTYNVWVDTDPLLQLGNGTSAGAPNDAFRINKNGSFYIGDASSTTNPIFSGSTTDSVSNLIGQLKTPPRKVTTSQTLKKSDYVVLASGDITLTAPAITAADSGLTMTVKNEGGYMDEVTFHINGTTADGITDAYLTRWQSRTIIANNAGEWRTKEKTDRSENTYYVAASASFTTPKQAVDFFNAHGHAVSAIILGSASYPIDSTIVVNNPNGYSLAIEGMAYPESKLIADTGLLGKPMFRAITPFVAKQFYADATTLPTYGTHEGEDFIRLLGSKNYYEGKDFEIKGFWDGVVDSTDASVWIQEGDFTNCHNSGVKVCGAEDSTVVRFGSGIEFNGCDKGVYLYKGDKSIVYIDGGMKFTNVSVNDTSIAYNPTLFTNTIQGYIVGTVFNSTGTQLAGYDFSRDDARDANWYVENNAGYPDENPRVKINSAANTDTTLITTGGAFYKARFDTTSTINRVKWKVVGNQAIYQPVNKRIVTAWVDVSVSAVGANKVISIGVRRNGTGPIYGINTTKCFNSGEPYGLSTNATIPSSFTVGDYLELYVSAPSNGDIVTVRSVNWYIDSK